MRILNSIRCGYLINHWEVSTSCCFLSLYSSEMYRLKLSITSWFFPCHKQEQAWGSCNYPKTVPCWHWEQFRHLRLQSIIGLRELKWNTVYGISKPRERFGQKVSLENHHTGLSIDVEDRTDPHGVEVGELLVLEVCHGASPVNTEVHSPGRKLAASWGGSTGLRSCNCTPVHLCK